MSTADERRNCPREEALFGAQLIRQGENGSLLVMDLSQRGCRGTTSTPLTPDEEIVVKIPVKGQPAIVILGYSRWIRPVENSDTHSVGIEFHSYPQPQDSERVLALLEQIRIEKQQYRTPPNEFERLRKIDPETSRQMSSLVKLNRKLNSSHKLEDVLESLLDIVTKVIRFEKALVLLDHGGPVPEMAASTGAGPPTESEYPYSRELVRQVLQEGLPVLSFDVPEDVLLAENTSLAALGTRSVLCVPLASGDKNFGVLYLDSSVEMGVFGFGDREVARVIAEMAAGAIERSRYLGMLIQSEKMSALGTLLAGIAHELNGPLTTVLGVADLVEDEELARMLHQQGTRCRDLVSKLTHLAHPWDANPRPVSLERVVESTLPLLKAEFQRRNVRLVPRITPRLPHLLGDEGSLSQVLLNLIQNALHALDGQPEPQIILDLQGSEEQVCLTISDNGRGIDPANLNRIFDPYFTTRERGEGTGLGLSLTRTIVEQHGGTIEASNSPGGGAVFRVVMPSPVGMARKLAQVQPSSRN